MMPTGDSRLNALSANELKVLEWGAYLNSPFKLDLLVALCSLESDPVEVALNRCSQKGLLWNKGGGSFSFSQESIRQSLLGRISDSDRQFAHFQIAQYLEKINGVNSDDDALLSYHYDLAQRSDLALPFALRVAQQAIRQGALELANIHYRIALRGIGSDQNLLRFVRHSLSEVLMMEGKYEHANEMLQLQSNELDVFEWVQTQLLRGEIAFRQGEITLATQLFESALTKMGWYLPTGPAALVSASIWEIGRRYWGRFFRSAAHLAVASPSDIVVLKIASRLSYCNWFNKSILHCFYLQWRAIGYGEQFSDTPELAQLYSNQSIFSLRQLGLAQSLCYSIKAMRIRKRNRDPWGCGQVLHFSSIAYYTQSRLDKSLLRAQRALKILDGSGDRWEANMVRMHLALINMRLGNKGDAVKYCERAYQDAIHIGNYQITGIILSIWSKITFGEISETFLQDGLRLIKGDIHALAQVWQAKQIFCLRKKNFSGALEAGRIALRLVEGHNYRSEYFCALVCWHTTAVRMSLENSLSFDYTKKTQLTQEAMKYSKIALGLARKYQNNLPHALRERALVLLLSSEFRGKKVDDLLLQSIDRARVQGAKLELCLSLVARGHRGRFASWRLAQTHLAQGFELADQLNIKPVQVFDGEWSSVGPIMSHTRSPPIPVQSVAVLSNRLEEVLAFVRKLSGSRCSEDVLDSIVGVVDRLLQVQIVFVLKKEPSGFSYCAGSGHSFRRKWCQSVCEEVLKSSRVVVRTGCCMSSCVLPRDCEGSAIGAPIVVNGNVHFVIYASHRSVRGLFGNLEIKIMSELSVIAGVAFEALEAFEERRKITDQFQLANDNILKKNQELEELFQAISHDLKSPLVTSTSFLDFLEEDFQRGHVQSAQDSLGRIRRAHLSMHQIMEQLVKRGPAGNDREDQVSGK